MLWLTPLAELGAQCGNFTPLWHYRSVGTCKYSRHLLWFLALGRCWSFCLINKDICLDTLKRKQTKMDQNTSPKLCTSSVCSVWSGCHISWQCTFPHPARQIMLSPPSCGSGGLISDTCQGLSATGSFHWWEVPTVFWYAGLQYVWSTF